MIVRFFARLYIGCQTNDGNLQSVPLQSVEAFSALISLIFVIWCNVWHRDSKFFAFCGNIVIFQKECSLAIFMPEIMSK